MFCPKCRKATSSSVNFCEHCGTALNQQYSSQPPKPQSKKKFYKTWWFFVASFFVLLFILAFIGMLQDVSSSNGTDVSSAQSFESVISEITTEQSEPSTEYSIIDTQPVSGEEDVSSLKPDISYIYHGEFLEQNVTGDICVLKYQISTSFNNKATINQNYHNVVNFIVDGEGANYKEIQYWAVAETTNGDVNKVISFTLNEEVISKIKNKEIVAIKLDQYLDDLWVLPSLLD